MNSHGDGRDRRTDDIISTTKLAGPGPRCRRQLNIVSRLLAAIVLAVVVVSSWGNPSRLAHASDAEGLTPRFAQAIELPEVVDVAFTAGDDGYWVVDSVGRVIVVGEALYWGGSPALDLDERVVALEPTASGNGYWLFTSKGRVVVYGAAEHHGERHGQPINGEIIDATVSPSGLGYWLLGDEGGVFAYGDARFHGSIQAIVNNVVGAGTLAVDWLDSPIVAMAGTSTGNGYWLVGADGGIFTFGDAAFLGSIPGVLPPGASLDAPIIDIVSAAAGHLLIGADGGTFSFGAVGFHGSVPAEGGTNGVVVAADLASDRSGYAVVEAGGVVHPFGSTADSLGHVASVDVSVPPASADTLDCSDFDDLSAAQQWFDWRVAFEGDPARLDPDGDRLACQNDLIEVEPGLKIALFGDSGIAANATALLELIRDEGADLVIHLGDFDYDDDPVAFEAWIDATLGPDFPYFATVGNHDLVAWSGYQANLIARLQRIDGAGCAGEYGVKMTCSYRGLSFVLSGVGTLDTGHEGFLSTTLAADGHRWRLCTWHKNQESTQLGAKTDEVGWEAFETCRSHGAIVVNGHEHSYSRTRTLTDVSELLIDPDFPEVDSVRVGPGQTFVAVSGLGGRTLREQLRCLPALPPYGCDGVWAAISSATNGAKEGALFFELGADGDPRKGKGTFIDVDGTAIDTFTIWSQNEAG